MTDPSTISQAAAETAAEVLDQAPAPTSACCQIGTDAFAESEAMLQAEYTAAVGELDAAETTLSAEFVVASEGWIALEQRLTVGGADPWVVNAVLTQFEAAELAWQASISTLESEMSDASDALQSAESFLSAEAAWFSASACESSESESESSESVESAEP